MFSATICIPTWNGMSTIPKLLESIRRQSYTNFDILIIDSSSEDGTYDYCASQGIEFLFSIPKSEFSHSQTRQLMAEKSKSDIVVFLTQDSIPANELWLEYLLEPFQNSTVVCSFSRHISEEALPNMRLKDHFDWLLNHFDYPLSIRRNITRWKNDRSYRSGSHFNSDNSAAYRREVLLDFPFPNVNYGEDQIWVEFILNEGYAVDFASRSEVIHWNLLTFGEAFDRGKLEATYWSENMDYDYKPISMRRSVAIFCNRSITDAKNLFINVKDYNFLSYIFTSVRLNMEMVAFWMGARYQMNNRRKKEVRSDAS